jgi:sugar transferase (PEP-CTERM system associated)
LVFFSIQNKIFKINILIFGMGDEAKSLVKEISIRKHLGYEIKGIIDNEYNFDGMNIANIHVLGNPEQLQEIVKREGIDKVVVALPDRRGKLPMETLLTCKLQGVDVEEGATFYEQISGKIALEHLRPSWIVFSQDFNISPFVLLLKRFLDIFLSVIGLVLATPVMMIIPLLIKLDSKGPVFYSQTRVGQHSEDFILLKFRSMCADAEANTGPVFAGEQDNRITRVGHWLRTTRLDELPQLVNVLKGEMSFVGPRPERPFFVESLKKQVPYYIQRLSVKPGITGWAQVNYPYGATPEDALEKLQLDLYYIKHMSLSLDLLIVLKTLKIAVSGEGAR